MFSVLCLSWLRLLCPIAEALLVPRAELAPQAFQQLPVVVCARRERVGLVCRSRVVARPIARWCRGGGVESGRGRASPFGHRL